jgi:hypothetical protein
MSWSSSVYAPLVLLQASKAALVLFVGPLALLTTGLMFLRTTDLNTVQLMLEITVIVFIMGLQCPSHPLVKASSGSLLRSFG